MAVRDEALALPAPEKAAAPWWRWIAGVGTFARRKPLGALGALVLIALILVAIFSPVIATHPWNQPHFSDTLTSPNSTYWFGTDDIGRDYFSRIVIASQVTVLAGIGTVLLAGFLSVAIGLPSGYYGGKTDMATQRVVDAWVAIPAIVLLLVFVSVLGAEGGGFLGLGRGPEVGLDPRDGDWIWYTFFRTSVVIFALGIIFAGYGSRVIRGAVIGIKENTYIEAARGLGATDYHIMRHYILPNIMPVVIILATLNLGAAVLAEATISFLGYGVQPPFPTWGQMLATDGRENGVGHEYLMFIPGAAIFLCVYGFNMLGDALRDVLDPRLRGTR
jgi:peptide/nickel transport system permease protein